MKNLIFSILSLAPAFAIAATDPSVVSLRVDFKRNGGEARSATLLARTGNTVAILDEKSSRESGLEISALPTEAKTPDGQRAVDVKFTISEIAKDGKKSVIAQPEVLVHDGKTATVSQTEKNGKSLELTVTPKIL